MILIWTYNRQAILEKIDDLWTTDKMARTGIFSLCPVLTRTFQHYTFSMFKQPPLVTFPPFQEGQVVEYRQYKFILPSEMKRLPLSETCFKYSVNGEIRGNIYTIENTLVLEVSDLISINILSQGRLSDDLKHFAEKFALRVLSERGCKEQYKRMKSKEFIKKMENELAEWRGWQAIIEGPFVSCSVLALRRLYIPPMLDSYQYVLIASIVDVKITKKNSSECKEKNSGKKNSQKKKEKKKKNLERTSPEISYQVPSKEKDIIIDIQPQIDKMLSIVENIGESVIPRDVSCKSFRKIIELRKKSLLMQFDEIHYRKSLEVDLRKLSKAYSISPEKFKRKPTLTPTPLENTEEYYDPYSFEIDSLGTLYSVSVVNLALNELNKIKLNLIKDAAEEKSNENSKADIYKRSTFQRSEAKSQSTKIDVIKYSGTTIDSDIETLNKMLDSLNCKVIVEIEDPESIIEIIKSKGINSDKSLKFEDFLIWDKKVANFVAAKLDTAAEHNGKTLIPFISNIFFKYLNKYKRSIGDNLIAYLIHIREKNCAFSTEMAIEEKFEDLSERFKSYEFNSLVFEKLIVEGQIATICNRKSYSLFPRLMEKIMKKTPSIRMIKNIYKYLNSDFLAKILVSCPRKDIQHCQEAYLVLLRPSIRLLYSENEELVIISTNFIWKLLRECDPKECEVWTFEFQSILLRNLHRTGSSDVAVASLRLLAFIIHIEKMKVILMDPKLKIEENFSKLCLDIKKRHKNYLGEDIYRLFIVAYKIGVSATHNGLQFLVDMKKYLAQFIRYKKPDCEKSLSYMEKLYDSYIQTISVIIGRKVKEDDNMENGATSCSHWHKIWYYYIEQMEVKPFSLTKILSLIHI
eukprot:TRINITY_DN4768_c0_g2_i1.p1 TRINITY_DN4768_c0_g2~~TRINITY_DN4768_c0_g2_i1.p1  ORF type:complete len:860 (-),score=133.08 TRINITY_DN4768_c0_g2_i1:128-2707(-)